jgi:hypothetical protein
MKNEIIHQHLQNAIGFNEYYQLTESYWKEGKLTGGEVNPAMLHYTEMNLARMRRVLKTAVLSDEIKKAIDQTKPFRFLVITEGWCGDAAQLVPLFHHIAEYAFGINGYVFDKWKKSEYSNLTLPRQRKRKLFVALGTAPASSANYFG